MDVRIADFCDFDGVRDPAKSNLSPFAIRFSSSTWVRRMLLVVQAFQKKKASIRGQSYGIIRLSIRPIRTWVTVNPFLKSTYFPSISPAISPDLLSRTPAALKVTLDGVRVLTSSEAPEVG